MSVRIRPSAPSYARGYGWQASSTAQFMGLKMSNCIFCKIINKEVPSEIIDENEHVIVFKDLHPKAPIHYLIAPKIHIESINHVEDTEEHFTAVREMFKMIRKIAKSLPDPQAFTLVSNNGAAAGQSVFHMHWHLLSGKNLYKSSGLSL